MSLPQNRERRQAAAEAALKITRILVHERSAPQFGTDVDARNAQLQLANVFCSGIVKRGGRRCRRHGAHMHFGEKFCQQHLTLARNQASAGGRGGRGSRYVPSNTVAADRVVFVDADDQCQICWAKLLDAKNVMVTNCGHAFHADCMRTWAANPATGASCPRCSHRTNQLREAAGHATVATRVPVAGFC